MNLLFYFVCFIYSFIFVFVFLECVRTRKKKQPENQTSEVSNPTSSETRPDFPSVQSLVAPTGKAPPQGTLEKKTRSENIKISCIKR